MDQQNNLTNFIRLKRQLLCIQMADKWQAKLKEMVQILLFFIHLTRLQNLLYHHSPILRKPFM